MADWCVQFVCMWDVKSLFFLVFMRPVFNYFETIYFLLQCLLSFIIIEYVYE